MRGKLPTRPGAREYFKRDVDGITGVTIHYTASTPRAGIAAVEAIAAYQVGPGAQEEFPAIAYPLIIDNNGIVYLCHDLDVRCWHSAARPNGFARNATHIGICLIGNRKPNKDQLLGLTCAVLWSEQERNRILEIEGHGDEYPTECPGPTWSTWKNDLMKNVQGIREVWQR